VEGGGGLAEGFDGVGLGSEVGRGRRMGGFGGSRGGELGALTPALSQQTGRGRKSVCCGVGGLVGEVGGFS